MENQIINILIKESGKKLRTVYRVLSELGISDNVKIEGDLKSLIVIYLKTDGPKKSELRQVLKKQITQVYNPPSKDNLDSDFKNYLLKESKRKDKQLRKKEKQLNDYSTAIVNLSNKLVGLVDDISMLRVEEGNTIKRLHDKNVLADLMNDLEPGSPAHEAIMQILRKLNS